MERETRHLWEILAVVLILFVVTTMVPLTALFVLGGAEEQVNLVKFFLYGVLMLSSVLVIIGIRVVEYTGWFDELGREKFQGFRAISIHRPSITVLGKTLDDVGIKILEAKRLVFIMFIIGMVFGTVVGVSGTLVSGVPQLVQGQISEGSALALSVEPAVSAETMAFNVVGLLLVTAFIVWYLVDEQQWDVRPAFIVGKVIAVPLVTLLFLGYHIFRYGAQEGSLVSVALLGFITNVLTAVTNSAIPAYFIHAPGNFFFKLQDMGLFADDVMIAYTIFLTIIVALLYIVLFEPWGVTRGGEAR